MADANVGPACALEKRRPAVVDHALALAEARCKTEGLRMTSGRRRVLGLLLAERRALGAYEIMGLLGGETRKVLPPIVYRALHFLTEHGFAHKIERMNAYVACTDPEERHAPAFMICRLCNAVTEAHLSPAKETLSAAARAAGFRIERTMVEAEGVCTTCASDGPA